MIDTKWPCIKNILVVSLKYQIQNIKQFCGVSNDNTEKNVMDL